MKFPYGKFNWFSTKDGPQFMFFFVTSWRLRRPWISFAEFAHRATGSLNNLPNCEFNMVLRASFPRKISTNWEMTFDLEYMLSLDPRGKESTANRRRGRLVGGSSSNRPEKSADPDAVSDNCIFFNSLKEDGGIPGELDLGVGGKMTTYM